MAVLKSITTGNFLTAGTWGLVDATSYNNSESTTTALTTSYQASSGSTTGVITVDGVALKLSVRTGTTGTMSVHLAIAGVEVTGTLVTINTADLPVAATADLNGGWHYFKFSAPVVLVGATSYTVEAKTSSSSQISLFSTSGSNWARALVTTTTQAPAAGDDLIVCGEYTGAGTSNSFTVTMDALASSITDYGAASTSLVTPSLAICNKGSLTYGATAATNYYLRQSGNVIVYSGGTLNIGTTGTPIPRDSSAILNFDCGANVDFGLTVRNLGTFIAQGLSRTSGKNIVSCKLNTDEAVNSTSLGVDTDTGWLDNDEIAVASTTKTVTQSEKGAMNGAAAASTLAVDGFAGAGGGLAFAHSGTTTMQAEVILLTRNVQIFGASATLQTYLDVKTTSTVDCDWVEFKWLGSGTANKRGLDVATSTGSFDMQYCSFHNFEVATSLGLNIAGAASGNIVFSNNVTFLIAGAHVTIAITSGTWTISGNIFMRCTDSTTMLSIADVGGVFTNNTIISQNGSSTGFIFFENNTINTFSGNTIHSCAGSFILSTTTVGTISNTTIWGISSACFSPRSPDLYVDGMTVFGGASVNIQLDSSSGRIVFNNLVSSNDSIFNTAASGISFVQGAPCAELVLLNCDFSTVSGTKTAHVNDIVISATQYARGLFINTKLGGTNEISGLSFLTPSSLFAAEKHDQTAGNHRMWKKYGNIAIETTTVHTGSQSVKLTPNNASNKLESSGPFGGFKVAVANGATVTPTVYVYEDGSYNGARARLIVKRNDALGITSDTVLDTATASSDAAWEALTGTTVSVTDDGTLEFVVDCDGTAGNLFVDSFSVA